MNTNKIPKLVTAKTIAESSKSSLQEVFSVIFLNNIVPAAIADDTLIFDNAQSELIVSLLGYQKKKPVKRTK